MGEADIFSVKGPKTLVPWISRLAIYSNRDEILGREGRGKGVGRQGIGEGEAMGGGKAVGWDGQ